jgi:hypothetical protein
LKHLANAIRDGSGQALLELTACIGAAGLALAGATLLLQAAWNRAKCSYLVFETAHARLVGAVPPRSLLRISVEETPDGVRAEALCGQARERIALPRLESARW